MGAPIGNSYYKLRSKDGRYKIFETPEDLANACNEYFDFVQNNPLMESQVVKYKDYAELISVPKMRAMSLKGLCNFLDISVKCFELYEKRKDFIPITTRVRQIIYIQKFEGASAQLLNPNIIARELGLQDSNKTEHTGEIIVKPPKFEDDN